MTDNIIGFNNPRIAVRELHELLRDDPQYRRYLAAERDEDAVEGALWIDDFCATRMIHERAVATGSSVAAMKLNTIYEALDSVLESEGVDRSRRRAAHRKAEEEAHKWRVKIRLGVPLEPGGDM